MRVLGISLGSLLVVGAVLLTLRLWGLSLPISEYQSDFFIPARPWLALEISTKSDISSLIEKKPDAILFLDLRISSDHVLFIQAPDIFENAVLHKQFQKEDYRGPKPYNYEFSFLKKEFPGVFSLEEVLQEFPQQRMILNLIDNAKDIHTLTVDLLRKYKLATNIVIHSSTDVILKSIKALEPRWLYGTSQAEVTRLLSLDSLGVLPAASIRSDVFIVPLKIMNRQVFNESLNQELLRRKKKIILGPLASKEDLAQAKKFALDGYIFQNFSDFEAALENPE